MRTLRRALALFIALFAFSCTTADATHEEFSNAEVWFTPEIKQLLHDRYAQYQKQPTLPEYAYCFTEYRVTLTPKAAVVEVLAVREAEVENATPVSVELDCLGMPYLHSHPPTDCEAAASSKGEGKLKWDCTYVPQEDAEHRICEPSETDLATMRQEWHRIGVIQCGVDRFIVVTAAN